MDTNVQSYNNVVDDPSPAYRPRRIPRKRQRGMFIVLEGGEGSGKTTQARLLADELRALAIPTLLTREPGDTPLGAKLRALLLDRNSEPMSRKAEALLFAADRAEHVEKVIMPALEEGRVVICDRYIASTMAYQVYATGDLGEAEVSTISDWASDDLLPDVTLFLDVDPVVGLERAMRADRENNRFEDKNLAFHERVRRGFLRQQTWSWITIDAFKSIEEVHRQILSHVLGVIHVVTALNFDACPECDHALIACPKHAAD